MGQVPDDLKDEIPAVEAEIDGLRERTQQIVAELERRLRARAAQAKHTIERVKHATDVRAQIKEHPGVTIAVSSVAAVALGVGVYVVVVRMIERRKPMNRLKGRLYAYKALLADPHRALRKKEPLGKRLLAAVLIAGATTIVKGLSTLLVKRTIEPRMLPPPRRELEA
jgi:ElaB/YqjD/DUF883 family membrane-anchored ribosome-binding protein